MNHSRTKSLFIILTVWGFLLLVLTGCRGYPTIAPVITGAPSTFEPTVATPTLTPAKLVLVDTQGQADELLTTSLSEFASVNSLLFETRPNLEGNFEGVMVAVVLDANDSLTALASSNPQTQFIGVGSAKIAAASNLSTILNKPQDLAFMAGHLTTLVSEDWRSGGLLTANGATIELVSDAFVNGGNYVCGWCSPTYPPYMNYPVYQDISGKTGAEMVADVEALSSSAVEVTFVSRAADVPEVIEALQTAEIAMIGENINSTEQGRYAAILGFDAGSAIEEMLPKILAGQGGQEAVSRVVLVVVNDEDIVTPGRQDLFNKAAEVLQGGWIIPLSVR